jgi:hypothetical protein
LIPSDKMHISGCYTSILSYLKSLLAVGVLSSASSGRERLFLLRRGCGSVVFMSKMTNSSYCTGILVWTEHSCSVKYRQALGSSHCA